MAVAEPAVILKTKDGGKNWFKVFEDTTKGMFLDAMDFVGEKGIVIGDPIKNKLFAAVAGDHGEKWLTVLNNDQKDSLFNLFNGEAFFASSGTNAKLIAEPMELIQIFFVSGGIKSKLFFDAKTFELPIIQGKESTGANSIDINTKSKKGVIVGGDFANDKDTTLNCVLLDFNNEVKFSHPQKPPHGYRSCVIYITENQLITCGTSGIDISNDGGNNWQLISNESFHVVQKAKKGTAVFLAGNKGRIAQLIQ